MKIYTKTKIYQRFVKKLGNCEDRPKSQIILRSYRNLKKKSANETSRTFKPSTREQTTLSLENLDEGGSTFVGTAVDHGSVMVGH